MPDENPPEGQPPGVPVGPGKTEQAPATEKPPTKETPPEKKDDDDKQ